VAGVLPAGRVVLSQALKRYYDPIRHPSGPVRLPVGSVLRTGCSRSAATGAGEGFPSSRAHPVTIPLSLPRRVPRRPHLQVLGAFHGLRRDSSGSAPSCPPCGATLTGLQASRDAAGWPVAPPNGAFDAALRRRAFPPTPAACYWASWQLPRPDSHRLASAGLRVGPPAHHLLSLHGAPRCWAHEIGVSHTTASDSSPERLSSETGATSRPELLDQPVAEGEEVAG